MDITEFIFDMKNNYESRKVKREEVEGLTVSTAWTPDMGYETAILDENGVHPVERYETIKEAEKGHEKWVRTVRNRNIVVIERLGYKDLVGIERITLKRKIT
jgi:hypothetical protein